MKQKEYKKIQES